MRVGLGGCDHRQIGAIWEYLLDGRQARTPQGLRSEPIELLAKDDHAVMLRRRYPDIGKRGIGVGFPGGVNLVYDAEQMRLAMIWNGRFADPGGVWRGQGSGTVRPLGKDLIRFEAGPDVDDSRSPWTVDGGRPPNHRFTGYHLDDSQRPTFTYRFEEIEVQDQCIDSIEDSSEQTVLKRTLTVTTNGPRRNLAFRVADGDTITRIDDRVFRVGETLRIQIAPPHRPEIVASEAGQRLMIPMNLPGGSTEFVLHYSW